MASFLDLCRFFPTAGGTTDWTVSAAVGGYLTPASAGAANGALYRYRAESSDLTQWELGYGTYNTSTGVLSRSTILFNSLGTTAKVGFSTVPQVAITALAEDLGGWTNRRLAKTAAYTVAQADNNQTIALGGNVYYALTFPQPTSTSFDSNHCNKVLNEDTGRGKLLLPFYTSSATSLTIGTGSKAFTVASGLFFKNLKRVRAYSLANSANFMSGFVSYSGTTLTMTVDTVGGSGTFTDWQIAPEVILWPGQNIDIFNDNGAWAYEQRPWFNLNATTLNVDPTNGKDTNDGLASGTGAFKTLNAAVRMHYTDIMQPYPVGIRIIDGGGATIKEYVDLEHVPLGGGVFQFQNFTWAPADSGLCLQIGDWNGALCQSITFDGSTTTSPVGYVFLHQHAVLDLGASVTMKCTNQSGSLISGDGHFKVNVNNGLTLTQVSGSPVSLYDGRNPLSQWNINGTHTFTGTPSLQRFSLMCLGSVMQVQGNVTWSGAVSFGQSFVELGGIILNQSGAALPGGAVTASNPPTGYVTTTGGGYYATAF
jgi:hypothetical protein